MNFNEKLIELRKKEGLSQEELGYKLNVTRQTISKWELGQTTPEMDKLTDISKLFGVSVDTLLSDTEELKIEDKKIVNDEQKNKKIVLIIVGIVAVLIILAIIVTNLLMKSFKGVFDVAKNGQNEAFQLIKDVASVAENQIQEQNDNKTNKVIKNVISSIDQQINEENNDVINSNIISSDEREYITLVLEMYKGTIKGLLVKTAIDEIITNNQKYNDNPISVTYNGKSTTNLAELQKLKSNFDTVTEYEVSYEYDENGYINTMDILNLN